MGRGARLTVSLVWNQLETQRLPALHSLPATCPPLLPLALLLGLQSRILWAYAQLGVYQPVLCDRLLQRLTAKEVSRMGHAAVAALLWACAKLQHQPPG